MNENTTVRLHIGRLVIDAGTPLPPGGLAGLQAALEAALAARLSQPGHGDSQPLDPAAPSTGRAAAAVVDHLASAIAGSIQARGPADQAADRPGATGGARLHQPASRGAHP